MRPDKTVSVFISMAVSLSISHPGSMSQDSSSSRTKKRKAGHEPGEIQQVVEQKGSKFELSDDDERIVKVGSRRTANAASRHCPYLGTIVRCV